MKSFRTELEDPVVERDIVELEKKIYQYKNGTLDEERFRSLRLARGIYGQRQQGVQMIRIKLPYGRVTGEQLLRIADVSDEYSTGRLHITTRQDIQIHHVSLERTPELWAQLERDAITLREACGNTLRNVTASELAGVDPEEPFDVSPYAHATFEYFLRNPISSEMGRKFKISFSSSEGDTALSYIHDLGFIPRLQEEHGLAQRGFKVLLGGGLGSQPRHATAIYEFLPADELIPLIEGVIRVFDRHGERNRRMKARMKFLLKEIGVEAFLKLVEEERGALAHQSFPIDISGWPISAPLPPKTAPETKIQDQAAFEAWRASNVIQQKQEGYFSIGVKVQLGDFYTSEARKLARLIRDYAGNEIRFSLRQNLVIRHVPASALPFFHAQLQKLGFAESGYNSIADITACPGTDTCNLGISNSTSVARVLEEVLEKEYPNLVREEDLAIKISGCMNACGQHMMAHIGFQGMSIKIGQQVAPALQILMGGGALGGGKGRFAEKVIKLPSKRAPQALRSILEEYQARRQNGESFLDVYDRLGKRHFYGLLKPLADTNLYAESDFVDWGQEETYRKMIGVGECAGVVIDLVATLLHESTERIQLANETQEAGKWADAIYHAYAALVNTAKALLTGEGISSNSHAAIIQNFQEHLGSRPPFESQVSFPDLVYQIKTHSPTQKFSNRYIGQATQFLATAKDFRATAVKNETASIQ